MSLPNYFPGFYISFLDFRVSLLSVSLSSCGQTKKYVCPRTSNKTMHSIILSIVLNRKTDRRILTIFLPVFRIQSTFFNGFADPAIRADRGFIQFFGPGFWILLAIKVGSRISTILRNALLCFTFCFLVTRKTYRMSRSTEIVTHQSQGAVTCCRRDARCYLSPHDHVTNIYPLQYYPILAVFGKLYDLTRFNLDDKSGSATDF